jgi:AcrR family transcriptional regulator
MLAVGPTIARARGRSSMPTPKKKAAPKAARVGHRTRVGIERRTRTRTRIVAAALRVFADKGRDAPVIDDFIRAAGVARGTFYNYFTRTEQLLLAVSQSLEDDLILSIEAEMDGLTDPVARLATGIRLWLAWARADPVWCAFIVKSRFRGPLVERQLAADLTHARKAGALHFDHVDVARDLVVGTILEAMSRIMASKVPRTYADQVTGTILRALGLDAASTARLLQTPLPRLRRPVQGLGATVPSSPR